MSRIVVLGGGESGVGAAILAKKKGFDVFLSDNRIISDYYRNELKRRAIPWEDGGHTEDLILNADEIIKSPGIPETASIVLKLKEQGTPIIGEIEFAGRYTDAKMICITGSNGKTTTTSLVYHIFKQAGYHVGLAGNIGKSLAWQVAEYSYDYYVIELSSFQLDTMYNFHADVAILLNITPDHLDRYDYKMQNYIDSKMRIIQNQNEKDAFVYWNDDPNIQKELQHYNIKSIECPFSDIKEKGVIGYIDDKGRYTIEQPMPFNMEQESLVLTGIHNIRNSLAAGIAADFMGVKDDVLRESLQTFSGVAHRMEYVGMVNDIQYINDSKATNVNACYYAIESIRTPLVLILGGTDKGNDYSEIKEKIHKKCRALIFLGVDNKKLHAAFDDLNIPIKDTQSMQECVELASQLAQKGDTVLLSPCCASFDLFNNMADRGNQFKEAVKQRMKHSI